MTDECASEPFDYVKAYLCFSWLCPNCCKTNYCDWTHWQVYQLDECHSCERAFKILEPWSPNQGMTPFNYKNKKLGAE